MTDDSPSGLEEYTDAAGTGIDTTVPHSARIWNYWLGGKDNFAVDRAAGDEYIKVFPGIVDLARATRAYLGRSVTYLAGEQRIRQFLDVGTGLPTADNTHQIAQRMAPEARIVYVDNDPLVLAHARALLTSTPEGATAYIHADAREPDKIIAEAAETLDFDQPIALIMHGIMGHIPDTDQARWIVRTLMDALPSGSYLNLGDGIYDPTEGLEEAQEGYNETGAVPYNLRTPEEIASFFDGLEPVEPGLVPSPLWRPDAEAGDSPAAMSHFGGVARKP
jgi:O-methyltransferase involved in polyketide biosynthesis